MASRLSGGDVTASINGGKPVPCGLSIEVDRIDVSTLTASKPDPSWTFVDAAGHFHAFDHDGQLPTIVRREELVVVESDEQEDGDDDFDEYSEGSYTITHQDCALCGEEIKPSHVPDNPHRTIPGRTSYTLTLNSQLPAGRFSVVVRTPERMFFGFAEGRMTHAERGPTGAMVSTYEAWCGPMSWRKDAA